jgi:polyketide synthase PksL
MGDGLEIAALTQAFRRWTPKAGFCPVGSVKANIGHAESAAGMAGLAKVLLQMRHGQLAPSIHSEVVNPGIDFASSPCYLQHGLTEWTRSANGPRRALINGFGAGGVNACVIVEEYHAAQQPSRAEAEAQAQAQAHIFALSAKNADRLREYARLILARVKQDPTIDLASLCYTLQIGREAMEKRLALIVAGREDLIARLEDWCAGHGEPVAISNAPADLTELASRWTSGQEIDWLALYAGATPNRISLPTYPFARDRHWVSDVPIGDASASAATATAAVAAAVVPVAPLSARLHPLIAYNSSTLTDLSFNSFLSDSAFYAVDHQVNDERLFPGSGLLEIACMSGALAGAHKIRAITDMVWIQPVSFRNGSQTLRTALRPRGDHIEYVITSLDAAQESAVHAEGRLMLTAAGLSPHSTPEQVSIADLASRCGPPEAGDDYYRRVRQYGLAYGPSFQTIREIRVNGTFALARLTVAEHLQADFEQFLLHPTLIDGALQTAAGLIGRLATPTPHVPFALDEVEIVRPVPRSCYACAEYADGKVPSRPGGTKVNIRLLNDRGDVLMVFRNLYVRPLAGHEG